MQSNFRQRNLDSTNRQSVITLHSVVMDNPSFDNPATTNHENCTTEQDDNRLSAASLAFSNIRNRKISRDTAPHVDNYRTANGSEMSITRPTLPQLYDPTEHAFKQQESFEEDTADLSKKSNLIDEKFGWIEGVLIRNMMSLWGVMVFLRLSWVVGQAGIGETLVIIAISTFITLVTALSMSAISTNGEIGGGIVTLWNLLCHVKSRILGPEFGGSIGIIFTIANVLDCAINVVGFSQAVQDMMLEYGGVIIVDGAINDIRIIGTATLIFICAICGLGAKYETKMKDAMFIVMMVSFSNFLVGSIMGPSSESEEARGFIGYSIDLLNENWKPSYTITSGQMQNFISVFSVYFPSNIGILAGANVSGNLKNPNKAIPKGTILAIIICSMSYVGIAIICAATVTRAATGIVEELHNGTNLNCNDTNGCNYGLYNDYQAMALVSAYAPLNYVGCFAATLSSALSDFFSCPALLEVIAADKIYPYWMIGFLGNPRHHFALTLAHSF
uniref:Amino acid permease/ SLC12A domain-containing protein n=1 Tax=Daphnia galeata TaxID=27404 RepID=A0A8J2S5B1_9CRUS|nr:unnamed protein product [Daphnia galeata]